MKFTCHADLASTALQGILAWQVPPFPPHLPHPTPLQPLPAPPPVAGEFHVQPHLDLCELDCEIVPAIFVMTNHKQPICNTYKPFIMKEKEVYVQPSSDVFLINLNSAILQNSPIIPGGGGQQGGGDEP